MPFTAFANKERDAGSKYKSICVRSSFSLFGQKNARAEEKINEQ